ncbi:MAG TPA: glycerol-3-phosphate acyltransferase, partial [Thermoanaerobaculia bacterium]|nr:glycerol-3-phosphate acyltransferase [Thermoanaerobaculia bacterium]
ELGAPPAVTGGVAVAAVLGHCYPLYLRFRGGKGGATGAGSMAVLALPVALLAVLVFALVLFWKRYVSLATMTAGASLPLLVLALQRLGNLPDSGWLPLTATAIAALIVIRHRDNLRRLRARTEPRVGGTSTRMKNSRPLA